MIVDTYSNSYMYLNKHVYIHDDEKLTKPHDFYMCTSVYALLPKCVMSLFHCNSMLTSVILVYQSIKRASQISTYSGWKQHSTPNM